MHATLWGKCIQLTFELIFTKYLQRFILKKKAILLRFQFSKFSAIYKTPIVILYRRLADTNLINIPKYSKRIYINIHTPRWAFKLLGSLLTRSTSIFIQTSVYFHVGTLPLVFKAIYNTDRIRYPISPFLYTAEPPTVRCPPKRS